MSIDFVSRSLEQVQGHYLFQGLWKKKVYNVCLLYTVLVEKHWKFLFHKIAYDLGICHEHDPIQLCVFKVIV